MTFKYRGRELNEASLLRIATQGLQIKVETDALDIVEKFESTELIVVANGERYDVLAGSQMLTDTKRNQFPARLVSKMLLKRLEDMTVNGTAIDLNNDCQPMREQSYEQRPRYDDRPREYRPRPQGAPYRPGPDTGFRPNEVSRSSNNTPSDRPTAMGAALLRAKPQAEMVSMNKSDLGQEIANGFVREGSMRR